MLVNVGLSDVATACPIETAVPDTETPVPAVKVVMLPVPSKLTPLMVLAVSKAVAVPALPEALPVTLPVKLPVTLPVSVFTIRLAAA